MAKTNPQDLQDLEDRLFTLGFTAPLVLEQLSDPISDIPIVLTLNQALPQYDNPRTTRNSRYDELRESIRRRNLGIPPLMTQRPGEDKCRIRNGGNTRLEILNELYKEAGDERYFRFNYLFRPWNKQHDEIIALTGHLAENDLKDDLKFIGRIVGIQKAKVRYEKEKGEPVGTHELSWKPTDDDYPVLPSHISRILGAVEILLPTIPVMLYSGLGKPQIEKFLSLRRPASSCWTRPYAGEEINLEMMFQDTLAIFDDSPNEFIFGRFQDELIDQTKRPLDLRCDQILLETINGQQEQRRGTLVDLLAPAAPPEIPLIGQKSSATSTTGQAQSQSPVAGLRVSKTNNLLGNPSIPPTPPLPARQQQLTDEERDELLVGHVVSPVFTKVQWTRRRLATLEGEYLPIFRETVLQAIPAQAGGLYLIADLWCIERSIDAPRILRQHTVGLAEEIALHVGAPDEIARTQDGAGYTYRGPNENNEITGLVLHLMTLLQALSGQVQVVLSSCDQQTCHDTLDEPQSSADFVQLLLGQPTTDDQLSSWAGRPNDEALVKLSWIIRFARRLVDLKLLSVVSE